MSNLFTSFLHRETLAMLFGIMLLFAPLALSAQSNPERAGVSNPYGAGVSNPPSSGIGSFTIENPLKFNSICGLIKGLLDAAIVIGIPIAVLFIVYAGLKYVLARGNPPELTKAHKNFLFTIVGIGIFLGSWVIIEVIINTVRALGVPGVGACN